MNLGSKGVKSEINVTPLVDVVLVLLIIFMVVTPLLQRGKSVVLPEAKMVSSIKQGGDPIVISVTADGKVFLDKEELPDLKDLPDRLRVEREERPGAPVLVKGDREVSYKRIRELMLELSKSQLSGVSLAATQLRERT
jgi:biopolymer transport protein ExbD